MLMKMKERTKLLMDSIHLKCKISEEWEDQVAQEAWEAWAAWAAWAA
jgi:hypothetical protein